jgi:hypothetical protein
MTAAASLPAKQGKGECTARVLRVLTRLSALVRRAKKPDVKPLTNSPNNWRNRGVSRGWDV